MAPRPRNDRDSDDDAPWLAEAEPRGRGAARPRTEVSRRSFFWTLVVMLTLAAVAAIGLIIAFTKKDGGSTAGYMNAEHAPLIAAEPGPYKVVPADPKGLAVEGQDQTLYAAGEGIDPGSNIDQSALPEEPLPRPGAAAPGLPRDLIPEGEAAVIPPAGAAPPPAASAPAPAPAAPAAKAPPVFAPPPPKPAAVAPSVPAPAPAPKPAAAKPPEPKPAARPEAAPPTAGKAGTVQLGAFSSPEKAEAAWASLAGKYGLGAKQIVTVTSGDKTLYRLRSRAADTAAACAGVKAAGGACSPVD